MSIVGQKKEFPERKIGGNKSNKLIPSVNMVLQSWSHLAKLGTFSLTKHTVAVCKSLDISNA